MNVDKVIFANVLLFSIRVYNDIKLGPRWVLRMLPTWVRPSTKCNPT